MPGSFLPQNDGCGVVFPLKCRPCGAGLSSFPVRENVAQEITHFCAADDPVYSEAMTSYMHLMKRATVDAAAIGPAGNALSDVQPRLGSDVFRRLIANALDSYRAGVDHKKK